MATAFISYRWEDERFLALVRQFAERLVEAGIGVTLDQFYWDQHPGGPDEGMDNWSSDQVKEAERILIVCSQGWFEAFEGDQPPDDPGAGLGAAYEARLIRTQLNKARWRSPKHRLVVLAGRDPGEIPLDFEHIWRFRSEEDFEQIVAWLKREASPEEPGTAFAVLTEELIPQAPEVRTAARAMIPFVKRLAPRIEFLVAYKQLHDDLQKLEDQHRQIAPHLKHLPEESSRWEDLDLLELEVDKLNEELVEQATEEITTQEARSFEKLEKAHEELKQAVRGRDHAKLRGANKLFGRLLGIWPSHVNTELISTARNLGLPAVLDSLNTLASQLDGTEVDARAAAEFKERVVSMIELHERLTDLIKRHDGWQELDNDLRQVEREVIPQLGRADSDEGLDELQAMWSGLKRATLALCAGEEPEQAAALNTDLAKLEGALEDRQSTTRRNFIAFRGRVTRRFNAVDHDLREECGKLQKLREDLTDFLEGTL